MRAEVDIEWEKTMTKKILIIAGLMAIGLGVTGCHGYNHRYDGDVGYVDSGYYGYGWAPYPAFSLSYYSGRRHHRHYHHRHHRRW
jgi:hypothetical protein